MSRHTVRVLAMTLGGALLWLALSASRATCVPIEPAEPACDPGVLAFPQDNPQLYEFYEVCVPRDAVGAEAELRRIDPTLYCGVAGGFAGCDRTREQGCHGDLTYAGPDTRRIGDEKWAQLCALSVHPLVTRVGGGHWVY
jgi:hypothetical protein